MLAALLELLYVFLMGLLNLIFFIIANVLSLLLICSMIYYFYRAAEYFSELTKNGFKGLFGEGKGYSEDERGNKRKAKERKQVAALEQEKANKKRARRDGVDPDSWWYKIWNWLPELPKTPFELYSGRGQTLGEEKYDDYMEALNRPNEQQSAKESHNDSNTAGNELPNKCDKAQNSRLLTGSNNITTDTRQSPSTQVPISPDLAMQEYASRKNQKELAKKAAEQRGSTDVRNNFVTLTKITICKKCQVFGEYRGLNGCEMHHPKDNDELPESLRGMYS